MAENFEQAIQARNKENIKSEFTFVGVKESSVEKYERIKNEVYQVEADGLNLFEYIKGDMDSIMGLPIKQIMNYIKEYNKMKSKIFITGDGFIGCKFQWLLDIMICLKT